MQKNNNLKNKALEVILYETDRAIFDFDTKRRKLVLPIVVDCLDRLYKYAYVAMHPDMKSPLLTRWQKGLHETHKQLKKDLLI